MFVSGRVPNNLVVTARSNLTKKIPQILSRGKTIGVIRHLDLSGVRICLQGTRRKEKLKEEFGVQNLYLAQIKIDKIKHALSEMTSLETFKAPVGLISFTEDVCKSELQSL